MLKNTKLHIVSFNLFMILIIGLFLKGVVYAAIASDTTQEVTTVEPIADTGAAVEEPVSDEEVTLTSSESSIGGFASATSGSAVEYEILSDLAVKPLQVSPGGNSGAAMTSIPIAVPAGRKGIQPNLFLNYNSSSRNGWIGVGWNMNMGAIQRNTKNGVDYTADDYVATMNGSASELVSRGDWGSNYYGAKIEGVFSQYYKEPSGGWVVTTKDGTKYYYGTATDSTQYDPAVPTHIFKWCLNRVEDTNGNYMTVIYTKDQGQIYLDRINYTGNTAGLGTTNYVKFYLEDRTDAPPMYTSKFNVITGKRLKTVEIVSNSTIVRAYSLEYDADPLTAGSQYSGSTGRSLLYTVQQFGDDGTLQIDGYGNMSGGGKMPPLNVTYNSDVDLFSGDYPANGFCGPSELIMSGDFNGDGMQDMFCRTNSNAMIVRLSTGTDFGPSVSWGADPVCPHGSSDPMGVGDFNGDGKTDLYCINAENRILIHESTGSAFVLSEWKTGWGSSSELSGAADLNGDGMTDMWYRSNANNLYAALSTGTSFGNINHWGTTSCAHGSTDKMGVGDFNGDGKIDLSCLNSEQKIFIHTSTGSAFVLNVWKTGWGATSELSGAGDLNGDGMTDMWYRSNGNNLYASLSTGTTFGNIDVWGTDPICPHGSSAPIGVGDFNGDGKTDLYCVNADNRVFIHKSTGSSFIYDDWRSGWSGSSAELRGATDINGDGKTDMWLVSNGANLYVTLAGTPNIKSDLASSISNGIGGSTSLDYKPSSSYTNKLLPFVVQTLSKVIINDGNGNDMITEYFYEGGNFNHTDRSFWGFDYVKATSLYTNGSTVSETWFENEDFIFKGFPLEQITSSAGNKYTRSVNTYDYTTPYVGVSFPRLVQKDDEIYDGTTTPKAVATLFNYDIYGNITKKSFLGEGGAGTGDERYEYTDYSPYDTVNWIVSLPKDTYVKDSDDATIKARQWFTYNTKGDLLTEKAWLDGGTDPVTTYTYDNYGNVETITDPKNNPSTIITYDTATHTFPVTMQNPLLQTATKTYHSVFIDKVETETGPNGNITTYRYDEFGRTVKVISPKDSDTYPTMTYVYPLLGEYGQIGVQKVETCAAEKHATYQSGSGDYICGETYFDGLGRTIKTRSDGPDSKTIVTETQYNDRGLTASASPPYFEGLETPRWTSYEYDPIGRVKKAIFPDTTYSTSDYLKGMLTFIDPNGHQKIEEKDIYGRLIKIEEYLGDGSPGALHVLYATTTYDYDILGNLRFVTDAKNNVTEIRHDTLSRKYWMDDPDMGVWEYDYDANGNLVWQKDAKLQEITFEYDGLNRIKKKIYPNAAFIEYTYDETFSTNYIGRLTTLIDGSGTTKYYYDELGQTLKTIKTIDLTDYTTETVYDALGRTNTLKYPDATIVKYEYGSGGNLWKVTDSTGSIIYAEYTGYNALGQYGQVAFSNGVITTYQYRTDNNRLNSILTNSSTAGNLISLAYGYDNAGNITGITDAVNSSRTRTYTYDELDRLLEAGSVSYGGNVVYQYDEIGNMTYNCRYGDYNYDDPDHKHAVTSITSGGQPVDTYAYDLNGNMTSGAGRIFSYDYDNRAESITYGGTATISVYDASGQRVKKTTPAGTTTYIGDIYECNGSTCTKYIFGGSQRIAKIDSTDTYYYHTDHLGSSSVITDSTGMEEQDIYYYPYGEIKTNTGSDITKYKFTDQEWDAESGLYYYNARYYDPKLARFISADIIVPNFADPQSLNRYSYVRNNPVKYTDPSGHCLGLCVAIIAGAVIGGASAAIQGGDAGDILKGMVIGAVSGAIGYGAGFYVGNTVSAAGVPGGVGPPTAGWSMAGSVLGGGAGGAAAGATASGMYGGDIGQGALYGAAGGAAFGGIGSHYGDKWTMGRVGMHGLAGGGLSELQGRAFSEGFSFALTTALSLYAYNQVVGSPPRAAPGGKSAHKTQPWGKEVINPVNNNFGFGNENPNESIPQGALHEESRFSNFMNKIRLMNATATFHDNLGQQFSSKVVWTYLGSPATYLPAGLVTYGAAAAQYPGISWSIYNTRSR